MRTKGTRIPDHIAETSEENLEATVRRHPSNRRAPLPKEVVIDPVSENPSPHPLENDDNVIDLREKH